MDQVINFHSMRYCEIEGTVEKNGMKCFLNTDHRYPNPSLDRMAWALSKTVYGKKRHYQNENS